MINIGLTGWRDHDTLDPSGTLSRNKLQLYSAHFPVVEVDASFYAIQPLKNYLKWVNDSPANFSFVIKAYQGMTGHLRGESPFQSREEMFDQFIESIQPVVYSGKLKAVLFQYPPWFECKKESVDMLKYTKDKMEDIPVALEFRNQTWFTPEMRDKTLNFMEKEGWIHSICDEPQAGRGSIPIVLHPTHPELTLVRFHGRNVYGWNQNGQANWREVRYLYRYNQEELLEWKENLTALLRSSKEICVLFNNNSGGDAADNAKEMIELLGIQYQGLSARQLDFFQN
jgi:uncharacterized protein YecE (DUF72 family)